MVKTGRKRKEGPRYPSGDLRPEDASIVGKYARMKQGCLKDAADPRHGSPLGRLHYEGKIVDSQRAAGEQFAELVHQHQRIGIDAPPRTPKISNMEPHIPGSSGIDYATDRVERIENRYADVCGAVMSMGLTGVRTLKLLHDVCAHDQLLAGYKDLMLLKAGLDRLCVIYGLTGVTRLGYLGK